jgi:single-stranded DNA-binding protein
VQKPLALGDPQGNGAKKEIQKMSYLNSVSLIRFVGSDPERRQAKGKSSKFTVFSLASQRSWKNADDEWTSKTECQLIVLYGKVTLYGKRAT